MPSSNPYVPTDAIPPRYFAGRKNILARAKAVVDQATRGVHGGILLSGHRGIGKTSALRAIEAGLAKDIAVVRIRFSRKLRLEDFAAELLGHIRAQMEDWKARLQISEIQLPVVTIRREPRTEAEASPSVALFRTFRALRRIGILWLSLDDMDYVDRDALSLLKSAMEEAQEPTVVMAVAGGPELRQHLVSEHSPIIRFFTGSDFDLSNFTLEETREALELPVRARSGPPRWNDAAVGEVHRWTAGYPYLVQCLAYSTFRDGKLDATDVTGSVDRALTLAGTWMEQEISHASDQDIRAFDKLATAGRTEWRSGELSRLGIIPIYVGRLVKLGVLNKIARGHYVVVKPPMIARYHMWRRNLVA